MSRTDHGKPGIYNENSLSLSSGEGSALATDSAGRVILSPNTPVETPSESTTPSTQASFGTVTKDTAKAAAGGFVSVYISNTNAAIRYFQIHNKASDPAGTEVPIMSFPIPAGTANAPGILILDHVFFSDSLFLSTGVAWAVSTTVATFTDSATASEHVVNVRYL